jgi:hypothetical protein
VVSIRSKPDAIARFGETMTDDYLVRLLYSAESLGYIVAGWAWWRVWASPSRRRLKLAAVFTAVGFAIKFTRVSLLIAIKAA